ncbi:hypothetical protein B0H19DRAFT_1074549 [Mycena capillaripes]|nr:hypothetical protein B0H19DRAFT_1074549 [Mycena capillaripes]
MPSDESILRDIEKELSLSSHRSAYCTNLYGCNRAGGVTKILGYSVVATQPGLGVTLLNLSNFRWLEPDRKRATNFIEPVAEPKGILRELDTRSKHLFNLLKHLSSSLPTNPPDTAGKFCVPLEPVRTADNGTLVGSGLVENICAYNENGRPWSEGNLAAETFGAA